MHFNKLLKFFKIEMALIQSILNLEPQLTHQNYFK
jgi:hypothetical protein